MYRWLIYKEHARTHAEEADPRVWGLAWAVLRAAWSPVIRRIRDHGRSHPVVALPLTGAGACQHVAAAACRAHWQTTMMICSPPQATPPPPTQQPTWPTAYTAHRQHCGHTALPLEQKTNPFRRADPTHTVYAHTFRRAQTQVPDGRREVSATLEPD